MLEVKQPSCGHEAMPMRTTVGLLKMAARKGRTILALLAFSKHNTRVRRPSSGLLGS